MGKLGQGRAKALQAEGTARAKALRQQCTWPVGEKEGIQGKWSRVSLGARGLRCTCGTGRPRSCGCSFDS